MRDEHECLIVILNEMFQIYQFKADVRNVIKTFRENFQTTKLKLGGRHACAAPVLDQLKIVHRENEITDDLKLKNMLIFVLRVHILTTLDS